MIGFGFHNLGIPGLGEPAGGLNGLIPKEFADQTIKWRSPYSMEGERIVGPSESGIEFDANLFLHAVDKPFEVWRVIVNLTAMDGAAEDVAVVFEPQPVTLQERVRIKIRDTSKNQDLNKGPTLVSALQKLNERSWEWPIPYTVCRQEGFTVAIDTDDFPLFCVNGAVAGQACTSIAAQVDFVRVEVTFEGYLLVLSPASETR